MSSTLPEYWYRDPVMLEREITKYGSRRGAAKAHGLAKSTLDHWAGELGVVVEPRLIVVKNQPAPGEIPVIVRDYSHEAQHSLYPLGDVHMGAATHDAKKWSSWLGYLENKPNSSLLGTGDFLNVAIVGSKSDVYDERMTVGQAKRRLRDGLRRLAEEKRVDALAPGNHEDRITRAIGDCPIRDVCDSLNVPYIESAALLVYRVGNQEYEIYMRHGTGNGQSLATLSKSGGVIRADIYITGHTHRQAVTADDFFVRARGKVRREKRYFVSSGSFLGYERYAAQRGYPPSRLGAPRIFLDGKRWDIHVSL